MVTTSDIPNILFWIRQEWSVSDDSIEALLKCLRPCRFGRRHMLVREGYAEGCAYFIEKGLTRSYWIVDGEEITTSFTAEGSLVFSMDEFYYNLPSQEYVETVERSEAYQITLDDLRELMATRLDLSNWARIIHQNEYRRLHQTHKERLSLPATERYKAFARQFPDICRRARLTDIASYIGVAPATLSRIRASLFDVHQ